MKTITLSNSPAVVIVSDEDYERVNKFRWFLKQTRNGEFYPARSVRYGKQIKTVWLHRFITDCPSGMTVDHKNMDRLNATRDNLEIVTNEENIKRRYGQ